MQVRVFEADDMRSALDKVKQALGPEALILSTRSIAKNRFGLPAKGRIEVTAAVDAGGEKKEAAGKKRARQADGRSQGHGASPGFESLLEENQKRAAGSAAAPEDALYQELKEMRRSFQGLAEELSRMKAASSAARASQAPPWESGHGRTQDLLRSLEGLGLSVEAMEILSRALARRAEEKEDGELCGESPGRLFSHLLAETLRFTHPLSQTREGQKRMAFVGPTGVGKTTTIAKLAATYLLGGGRKIVLATIDNYRIAAVEQLKIYGQIMNLPVEVARSPQALEEILCRHADAELVLIDTAGRSPRDEMGQQELAAFLPPELNVENYLLLSTPVREADQYRIIERFGHLGLSGLILTKLDECEGLGGVANLGVCSGYPLAFLTNGQRVPEDLLIPDAGQISEMILHQDEVIETWSTEKTGTRPERFVH
jgi:flagellar biosynthesis protein FlhF